MRKTFLEPQLNRDVAFAFSYSELGIVSRLTGVVSGQSLLSTLGNPGAKRSLGLLLEPIFFELDISHLLVLGAVGEEINPVLQSVVNLLRRDDLLLGFEDLQLGTSPLRVVLLVVDGEVHFFQTAQIGSQVFLEAASDKGARGITAGKDAVGASGAVHVAALGDVIDGTVDGEIDGFGFVGAIVGLELVEGVVCRASLRLN